MDGIFGDMFDFNGDGQIDSIERAIEFQFLEEVVLKNEDDEDEES